MVRRIIASRLYRIPKNTKVAKLEMNTLCVVYRGHNDDHSLMMMIMTLKVTVTIEDTNDYGLVTKIQSVDY